MLIRVIAVILLAALGLCLEPADIVITVISQHEGYHAAHAKLLRDQIIEEAVAFDHDPPKIVLTHEKHLNGSWTIFPLLPLLLEDSPEAQWFVFCLDNTAIRLRALVKVLGTFKSSKNYFIGHALYDEEPTIIHHFADHRKKLKYPNVASAFAITKTLLQSLNKRIENEGLPDIDFSIDSSYEFANFIYNNGKGTKLTHVPEFCVFATADCVSHPKAFHACTSSVSMENVLVAIKTYDKNYKDRIPILKKTWLKHVQNYRFFSNVNDNKLKNVIVVPDTKEGHCAKTYGILEHANSIMSEKKMNWLIIVDDDTILSVQRLTRLLTCYNPKNPTAIGERYGYRVIQATGYEYLTGGAGLALSAPLVKQIIETQGCRCPTASTPDDMYLFGICLNNIGIRPTHSPLFHQARPTDYSLDLLASQEPISFHKFWMIDPIQVYEQWFADVDRTIQRKFQHTEL